MTSENSHPQGGLDADVGRSGVGWGVERERVKSRHGCDPGGTSGLHSSLSVHRGFLVIVGTLFVLKENVMLHTNS